MELGGGERLRGERAEEGEGGLDTVCVARHEAEVREHPHLKCRKTCSTGVQSSPLLLPPGRVSRLTPLVSLGVRSSARREAQGLQDGREGVRHGRTAQ